MATDLDTNHTYKLAPQRLISNLQKLGLVGEVDHCAGGFWWNQPVRVGGTFPSVTVTFGGTWADGDGIWLNLGGLIVGNAISGGTSIRQDRLPDRHADLDRGAFRLLHQRQVRGRLGLRGRADDRSALDVRTVAV